MDTCTQKAQQIVQELAQKHFPQDTPVLSIEMLPLASCGLMGDNRVYGYAWAIHGVTGWDDARSKALLREAGLRLTNEVTAEDGTRFVRVFVSVT